MAKQRKRAGKALMFNSDHLDNNSSNSEAEEESHVCHHCQQTFSSKWNLKMHQQRFHERRDAEQSKGLSCSECGRVFAQSLALKVHYSKRHGKPETSQTFSSMKSGLIKMQKERLGQEWDAIENPGQEEILQVASELKVTVKQITGWLKKRKTQQERKEREEGARDKDLGYYDAQYREDSDDFKEMNEMTGSHQENYYEEEDEVEEIAPKLPYNPGHKKTKFSEFQRNHLRHFFQVFILLFNCLLT